jgi:multidrug efflux pump
MPGSHQWPLGHALAKAVVQIFEQQMSGVDHLLYFSSESDKDGSMTITLNFEQGTNPDIAQVQVQNKLTLATPLLPTEVQQQGISVTKATKNFLMVVGFVSTDGSLSGEDIADYVASHVQDPVSRTPGVGTLQLFGAQYAMRIWIDPAKLSSYRLTPVDVNNAITAQNVQVTSGEVGGLPAVRGQELDATEGDARALNELFTWGCRSPCPTGRPWTSRIHVLRICGFRWLPVELTGRKK